MGVVYGDITIPAKLRKCSKGGRLILLVTDPFIPGGGFGGVLSNASETPFYKKVNGIKIAEFNSCRLSWKYFMKFMPECLLIRGSPFVRIQFS